MTVEHKDRSKVGTTVYRWSTSFWKDDDRIDLSGGEAATEEEARQQATVDPKADDATIIRGTYELDPDEDEWVDGQLVEWVTFNHDSSWQAYGNQTPKGWEWEVEDDL